MLKEIVKADSKKGVLERDGREIKVSDLKKAKGYIDKSWNALRKHWSHYDSVSTDLDDILYEYYYYVLHASDKGLENLSDEEFSDFLDSVESVFVGWEEFKIKVDNIIETMMVGYRPIGRE